MKKKYNYNYVFIMYDVEEIRCNKVFKVCKKYLEHYQNSVFRGNITPSKLVLLKSDLDKIINKDKDVVSIIKLINKSYFDEELIGKQMDSEIFL